MKKIPQFNDWEGRSLNEIFSLCREYQEDHTYPTVKKWREAGGKVLGHFQVYFPEEIAHACGMLPVRIRGGHADGVEASQHFGSYLCSILKTSLDLALCKHIELEMFVTHPICDGARNLAGIWGAILSTRRRFYIYRKILTLLEPSHSCERNIRD